MDPITREEYFLAKIAGEESPTIQPVTREEMFLARAAGMDAPELTPVTRKEWFISQISGGGGGGGVTVSPLTVTENGTYTAPEGSAYSPVSVNVQSGGGESAWDALLSGANTEIYSEVSSVRDYAFYMASSLTGVNFPSVNRIGQYAFTSCTNLANVSIPKATFIGQQAFNGCSSMEIIDLPSATSIRSGAFISCSKLKTMILRDESTVCSLASSSSIPSTIESIYVPDALVNSYKSASNWSSFASKIKPLSEYVE